MHLRGVEPLYTIRRERRRWQSDIRRVWCVASGHCAVSFTDVRRFVSVTISSTWPAAVVVEV